ncbi:MAG: branched-chain amino acid transaminase [Candidatus Nitrosocaldus sp.]|nr:branched-chain amino acid transaminase [Candidatus Nitrosocaldus sp.]MDW8275121.1 branched-chain amino acid transaminase [Candidatus Nitrosocaldus sp.]
MSVGKGMKIWMNGSLVDAEDAKVHVLTHALHYATGIFEGIRCYESGGGGNGSYIFRLHDHVKRFFSSAKIYMMDVQYGFDDIVDAIIDTVKANGMRNCYIRPIAYYSYGRMGVNPLPNKVDVAIAVWKWDEYLSAEQGIRCMVSSWRRIDARTMPVGAKATANYANSALARIEALKNGFDEAIMLNINGMVAEASAENVFMVRDGVLCTPPTTDGALAGITRDTVLQIAKHEGIMCEVRSISRDELYLADEAFLTGTAAGIKPIVMIDNRKVGDGGVGVITKRLKGIYEDVVRGRDERFVKWLTYVEMDSSTATKP